MTQQEEIDQLRAEKRRLLLDKADRCIREGRRLIAETERNRAERHERWRRAGIKF
jgi:hypothetical protein